MPHSLAAMDPCTTTPSLAHRQAQGVLLAEENTQLKGENLLLRQRIQALEQVLQSTPQHYWTEYEGQRICLLLQGADWEDDGQEAYEEEGDWNSFSSRLGPGPHLPTRPSGLFCEPLRNRTTATLRHTRVVEWQQQHLHRHWPDLCASPHLPLRGPQAHNGGARSERSDDSGLQQSMICNS